jgi:acyl-coenzyme A thioesterase PaaI-like protein
MRTDGGSTPGRARDDDRGEESAAPALSAEANESTASKLRRKVHPNCVVCSPENEAGLQLDFSLLDDGSVQASFGCTDTYEGFAGILHGGVISSLLDGAMTNCLFAHGLIGITGDLQVRFRRPVFTNQRSHVRAWINRSFSPFHVLKAEIVQERQVKAKATGRFVEPAVFAGSEFEKRLRECTDGKRS